MAQLLDQLEADWRRITTDPTASRAMAEICHQASIDTLAELPAWARATTRDEVDAVFLQLADQARLGDELSATVLLHLLWPGVLGLVRRWRALGDIDERASAAVNAVYARIRTYPVERRPRAVAANILLDAAKELRRQANQVTFEPVGLAPVEDAREHACEPTAAEELADLLSDALRQRVISREDAQLIARSRIGGMRLAELDPAVRLRTLQRRRQTAEQRLVAAAAA
jgi:hypothetical protein